MTMSIARPDNPEQGPAVENVLDTTTSLLRGILAQLKELHSLGQTPTATMPNLSPAAGTGNNGRIVTGSPRLRIERLVIVYTGAITFTVQVGSASLISLPATTAGATGVIDLPFAYVLDRGVSLQILAGATTWAAYAIGYPE